MDTFRGKRLHITSWLQFYALMAHVTNFIMLSSHESHFVYNSIAFVTNLSVGVFNYWFSFMQKGEVGGTASYLNHFQDKPVSLNYFLLNYLWILNILNNIPIISNICIFKVSQPQLPTRTTMKVN